MAPKLPVLNILTIDVEDWFHTSALEPYIAQEQWEHLPSTLRANVNGILEILSSMQTHATFFILGWVAERYPDLVRNIVASGHEIASHGYRHRLIYHLSPVTFRDYVKRAKHLLEDLSGKEVRGYRATSFSVVNRTLCALEALKEAGFFYDSSIFPIGHDIYGIPDSPRFPYVHANGLVEIPPSTVSLWGKNFPVAGGGYFRLYPYWLTRLGLRWLNRAGHPGVVYLHPWEFDPACPHLPNLDWRTGFRQYINLKKTMTKFKQLLADFQFVPIKDFLESYRNQLPTAHLDGGQDW